jgi:hypothetical protein
MRLALRRMCNIDRWVGNGKQVQRGLQVAVLPRLACSRIAVRAHVIVVHVYGVSIHSVASKTVRLHFG